MKKEKIDKLYELYNKRNEYRKFEKEVYSTLTKEDLGMIDLDDVSVRVGMQRNWAYGYTTEMKDKISDFFNKLRKNIKPKEVFYVCFYKKEDDN
jgi:hypothetical protein